MQSGKNAHHHDQSLLQNGHVSNHHLKTKL